MRYIVTLLLLTATVRAWAEWMEYAELVDRTYYIDTTTIRNNGDLRRVWELRDMKHSGPDGIISFRFLVEYDCKEARSRWLQAQGFSRPMAGGEILLRMNTPGEWEYVAPATVGKVAFEMVCGE
jgi:hypothetical protein